MKTKTYYILMEKTKDGTWSNMVSVLDNESHDCIGRQWISDIVTHEWITMEDVQAEVERNGAGFVSFAIRCMTNSDSNFTRQWCEDLYKIYQENQDYALRVVGILRDKQTSKFMSSLKTQIIKWLNTPREQRQYASPLSLRQYQVLKSR